MPARPSCRSVKPAARLFRLVGGPLPQSSRDNSVSRGYARWEFVMLDFSFVGLDVSHETTSICVVTREGTVLEEKSTPTTAKLIVP